MGSPGTRVRPWYPLALGAGPAKASTHYWWWERVSSDTRHEMLDSHGLVTVTTGTRPMISLTPPAAQGVKGGATPQREAERQRSLAAALDARSRRWPTLLSQEEPVSEAWP